MHVVAAVEGPRGIGEYCGGQPPVVMRTDDKARHLTVDKVDEGWENFKLLAARQGGAGGGQKEGGQE